MWELSIWKSSRKYLDIQILVCRYFFQPVSTCLRPNKLFNPRPEPTDHISPTDLEGRVESVGLLPTLRRNNQRTTSFQAMKRLEHITKLQSVHFPIHNSVHIRFTAKSKIVASKGPENKWHFPSHEHVDFVPISILR